MPNSIVFAPTLAAFAGHRPGARWEKGRETQKDIRPLRGGYQEPVVEWLGGWLPAVVAGSYGSGEGVVQEVSEGGAKKI